MTEKPADEPVPEGVVVSKAALRRAKELADGEKRSKPADEEPGEIETR